MRRVLPCLALALLAASAHAGGVNMRWTRCYGDGGVLNRTFACNTNIGTNLMVGSFVLDSPLSQVSANESWIDIQTAAPTLPAWWQFKNTGSCRISSLNFSTVANPEDLVCVDWTQGMASGGIGTYTVGVLGPNTAQIHAILAVPPTSYMDLPANQEYFSFNLLINNVKTVGTAACSGCTIPACLALSTLKVYFNGSANTVQTLTTPAYGTNSNYISWQNGDGIVPFPNGTCAGFDTAGFAVNTSVVGRGTVLRSRTKAMYPPGSPLTLTAVPADGDRFVIWSGDVSSPDPSINVIVNAPLSLTANFERDPAAAASITSVTDVPNDQGSKVTVQWNRSSLDNGGEPDLLCCYQVQRRLTANPGDPWVAAGDEIGSIENLTYSQVVSTSADATALDPAQFQFRVVARTGDDSAEWISAEDQGHSIDNLAPPAPASVSGSMSSGLATFFWPAVNVPDLDHYAIYRGIEDVPPTDPAHRIATTTNTGYNDSPGYFAHYLVTAVDVHGNEGAATAFVPINSAGVGDRPAPGALTVGRPTPSPMTGAMSMAIGLPRAMSVTVDVVDAQGRFLRRLNDGVASAGWLNVSWDARDAQGRQAAAGIYFVRVRTSAGEQIRRLALLP